MHPDLLPFAEDGFGNRFCFVCRGGAADGDQPPVAYWMYETYRALPIASSFCGFLYWAALTAHVAARRGDPIITATHIEQEFLPVLAEIGLDADVLSALESPDPDAIEVHRALTRLHPSAPGSRLAIAVDLAAHGRMIEALEHCREASEHFPEFAGASSIQARILGTEGDQRGMVESLVTTLGRPLIYGGDPLMPHFRDVPEVDPSWVVEQLTASPILHEQSLIEPIWTLVFRDDPTAAKSWAQLALDCVHEERLEAAVIMATIALLFGFNTAIGDEIHALLAELYGALGWGGHAQAVERWLP